MTKMIERVTIFGDSFLGGYWRKNRCIEINCQLWASKTWFYTDKFHNTICSDRYLKVKLPTCFFANRDSGAVAGKTGKTAVLPGFSQGKYQWSFLLMLDTLICLESDQLRIWLKNLSSNLLKICFDLRISCYF